MANAQMAKMRPPLAEGIMRGMARVPVALLLSCSLASAVLSAQSARPRARDIGLAPGVLAPGAINAITDVRGVRVGHTTLVAGDNVRTGVTVIVPHGGNVF